MQNNKKQVLAPRKYWNKAAFIEGFVSGTLGNKRIEGNYSTVDGRDLIYNALGRDGGTETIAVRLESGLVFSNANTLRFADTHMAWGSRTHHWGQAEIQRTLESLGAMPLPFSVFTTANLNIREAVIVEKADAEDVSLTIPPGTWNQDLQHSQGGTATRHYVGACLLKVGGSCFLFDIDREEIKHGRFNPFVVKLPREAKSIAEAYEMLIPQKVADAIAQGLKVERQGEWFFVHRFATLPEDRPKATAELIERATRAPHVLQFGGVPEGRYTSGSNLYNTFTDPAQQAKYEDAVAEWTKANVELASYSPIAGELRAGKNRPNTVERFVSYNGMTLVSGKVKHTGREHRDLDLGAEWFEAIPNAAVESWQVSGDID